MGESVRKIDLTPELVEGIRERSLKCFLCRWTMEDIHQNGKLTGYPLDYNGKPEFPIEGKIGHMELEGFIPKLDASPGAC